MGVLRFACRAILLFCGTTGAIAAGAEGLPAGAPCNCGPGEVMPGVGPYGETPGFVGEAPPPAMIFERTPCRYTPHDVDPCFDLRCYLYPMSPKPPLYVQAEFVPLFRDSAFEMPFQSFGPEGRSVLGTQTLDMEFQGGLRFLVGGRVNDIYRIESSFMGFQHWADTDTARDFSINNLGTEGNLFSPFSNFGDPAFNFDGGPNGIVGLDFNHSARLSLQSSYDSVESNVLVDIPRMRNLESSVLFGARYTRIDEELTFQTASVEPVAAGAGLLLRNGVQNDLYGLQLGYRGRFLVETRAWLDFDLRGAMYQNNIEHRLGYEQTQGAATVGAFADEVEDHKTTFGGDVSLVMNYLVTPSLVFRLGYQALWFDSLALAAENAIPRGARVTTPVGGPNTVVFPPLEIDHTGEVVYHGPVAGIVWMW